MPQRARRDGWKVQVAANSPKTAHTWRRWVPQRAAQGRGKGQVAAETPEQAHTWQRRMPQRATRGLGAAAGAGRPVASRQDDTHRAHSAKAARERARQDQATSPASPAKAAQQPGKISHEPGKISHKPIKISHEQGKSRRAGQATIKAGRRYFFRWPLWSLQRP